MIDMSEMVGMIPPDVDDSFGFHKPSHLSLRINDMAYYVLFLIVGIDRLRNSFDDL